MRIVKIVKIHEDGMRIVKRIKIHEECRNDKDNKVL